MTASSTSPQTTQTSSIHPGTQVGLLALSVADLGRSLEYYTKAIGFSVLEQRESQAVLGVGETPLLVLMEQPGATQWPRGGRSYTGLYHFAILLPTRADLGRWLRNWFSLGMTSIGQGDHNVSEALYLEDPDGHGIEVYRDRPRSEWQWVDGRVQMGTGPVDIQGAMADADAEGQPWNGLPEGTRIGHVHLQVGDINEAAAFYHDVLGFDIVASMPSALFISAGGYHHHIGMNIWHSRSASPAPEGSVALKFFTVEFPDEAARQAVVERVEQAGLPVGTGGESRVVNDPWGNTILLHVGPATREELAAAG